MRCFPDSLLARRFAAVFVVAACLLWLSPSAGALFHAAWARGPRPLLVGYFGQWGLYNDPPYRVKDLVANGSAPMLDQINYAQGFVTNGVCSVADPNADLGTTYSAVTSVSGRADDPLSKFHGYFHQLQELKRRYPHLKILISLEGRASSFADDARPEKRQAFVASCVDRFVKGNFAPGVHEPGIFDGFDIDWEYPQGEDAQNFRALLTEFRRQMDAVRPGMRLSVAVGPAPGMEPGTDFHQIAHLVDQVGVMNYDYTGPWNPTTGFLAPLFAGSGAVMQGPSIAHSMASYEAAGVPRRKLLMGLPFYGYSWTGVGSDHDGLFQRGHGVRGDRPYRYIRTLAGQFSAYRDPVSHAAWLFNGTTFWTYDDPVSVRYKASYAARSRLGGVMIWELSEDTPEGELLHIAHASLVHPLRAKAVARPGVMEAESAGNAAGGSSGAETANRE